MSTIILKNRGTVASRTSTHQVMANSGFGKLTVYRPDGAVIVIPQSQINNHGLVKSGLQKELCNITKDKIDSLEKRGVRLYIGKVG